LLEDPQAQALLVGARVTAAQVGQCQQALERFIRQYLPFFYRAEHRSNARIVIEGLLSGLQRKTAEPIARQKGVHRKRLQLFVGGGKWDDEAVMGELRRHVVQEMGDPQGVLVLDPSAFPKKGAHSCGVARTWCGRLGKKENCQVGVFLAYATDRGQAPLDRQLYLPKDWAADPVRRRQCYVPPSATYQERWEMGLKMIQTHGPLIPHCWVTADDEFGRVEAFREGFRQQGEAYIVDVPVTTTVLDLSVGGPLHTGRTTNRLEHAFCQVHKWVATMDARAWREIYVKDGDKGPIRVQAIMRRVQTRLRDPAGPEECLVVMRRAGAGGKEADVSYHLAWAPRTVTLKQCVHARARRHQIEQMFEHGKGEAGLDHYEVRSYVGWHHHMTLSLVALWFLCLERLHMGKKRRP
jgi:SRSO17 transposase